MKIPISEGPMTEPYDYEFYPSFGGRLAVTKSEFMFYGVLRQLAMSEEITMPLYLTSQWFMIKEGWINID